MRFKGLDLNLLVAFDMLMAEKNVTRAAKRLHMTQSAMSNALSRLRHYFGDDLLVPIGRRMEMTPRAELLWEPVRDILVRVEASIGASPSFDPSQSDRCFRICVSDYTLSTLVPTLLRIVAERGYKVRFDFKPQSDQPYRVLEQGEADLLIIPSIFVSDGHPSEILYLEDFVCLLDGSHPRISGALDADAFAREQHAVVQPSINTPSFETAALRSIGIARDVAATAFSFASLPQLLVGTSLIGTIHRRLAEKAVRQLPLKMLELPFALPPLAQAAHWHRYRSNDPGITWLRAALRESAARP